MSQDAKDLARDAKSSTTLHVLARSGYAALGLVHLILGIIILVIAFGGEADSDQSGAFEAIAAAPLGFLAIWVLAIALWALSLWQIVAGLLITADGVVKKWGQRLSHWGQAFIYAVLGLIGAGVAIGARPNGEQTVEQVTGAVLSVPGGLFLIGAIGLGIGIGGIVFGVIGVRRGFRKQLTLPRDGIGHFVAALGVVGYIAKGVALLVVGVLLVVAAVTVDADAAGGYNAAIQALLALAFGPLLVATVGVGFLAYGVFLFFRVRYARL